MSDFVRLYDGFDLDRLIVTAVASETSFFLFNSVYQYAVIIVEFLKTTTLFLLRNMLITNVCCILLRTLSKFCAS